MDKHPAKIEIMDIQMGISVAICFLSALILSSLGVVFKTGGRDMEILQKMTPCIACLLCCQDNTRVSFKAGVNRLIITAIGGLTGIVAALIDTMVKSDVLMVLMIGFGIILTLLLCKAAKVPYINARIGGVTFILVACTFSGTSRMWYAIFRLVSTFYGIIITLLVSWIFSLIHKDNQSH